MGNMEIGASDSCLKQAKSKNSFSLLKCVCLKFYFVFLHNRLYKDYLYGFTHSECAIRSIKSCEHEIWILSHWKSEHVAKILALRGWHKKIFFAREHINTCKNTIKANYLEKKSILSRLKANEYFLQNYEPKKIKKLTNLCRNLK